MRSGRCGAESKTGSCAANCKQAKRFGMETLDHIIETREEFDEDFRRDYFEWHIQYHLGEDEKRAIAKFCELLRKHNLGPVFRAEVCELKLRQLFQFLHALLDVRCVWLSSWRSGRNLRSRTTR